jgi:hypothetical protein
LAALLAEQPLTALLGQPLLSAVLKAALARGGQAHRHVLGCGEFVQQRLPSVAE